MLIGREIPNFNYTLKIMKIIYYSRTEIRIALAGGGTGGHIFPLIAIARAIKRELEESKFKLRFIFLGPDDFGLDIFSKTSGR